MEAEATLGPAVARELAGAEPKRQIVPGGGCVAEAMPNGAVPACAAGSDSFRPASVELARRRGLMLDEGAVSGAETAMTTGIDIGRELGCARVKEGCSHQNSPSDGVAMLAKLTGEVALHEFGEEGIRPEVLQALV